MPTRRNQGIRFERWRELSGVVLVGLGIVTLLSILPTEHGTVTESWLSILYLAFGWGMYLMPFMLGAAGLALILRGFGRDIRIRTGRVLGLIVLFLLFLGFLGFVFPVDLDAKHLRNSGDMGPGGYLGIIVSQFLTFTLGQIGAFITLWLLVIISLSLVLEASPLEFVASLADLWQSLRDWYRIRFKVATNTSNTTPVPRPEMPVASSTGATLVPSPASASSDMPTPSSLSPGPIEVPRSAIVPHFGTPASQPWQLPALETIFETHTEHEISQAEIRQRVKIIEDTLASFGVPARVVEVNQGPAITQFGVEPGFIEQKLASGRVKRVKVKVSKISALANDLALALAASPIRIEAPVPGRNIVGIEVPNMETSMVSLRSVMESEAFQKIDSNLKIALGQDVSGQAVAADLAAMPHLLIAGATGSGKSVCINSLICCLLCNNTPDDLRFILVDPKMVELTGYNGIPHLFVPVVVELERVVEVLHWTTQEMDRRYRLFSKVGARNLEAYNASAPSRGESRLPKIVVVIDELADLMMIAPEQVERSICRIAQMARATGIHLVIATQRPSVDVITGLIKANFPARIAFAVTSQVDSRVILDTAGAERLLGRGDMLFMAPDSSKIVRLQGCYVSDREIASLVRYWKHFRVISDLHPSQPVVQPSLWEGMSSRSAEAAPEDNLLDEAIKIVRQHDRASISLLQRRLRIGYTRAARLIDIMYERGIIGAEMPGGQPREVLRKNDANAGSVES